jgi:hypothetical protein
MSKHNILRISSHEKTPKSESNTNFTVNYANDDATSSITRLILKSMDIPNVFYNITNTGGPSKNGNNEFTYRIGSTLTTRTVLEGQYTLTELITALQTQNSDIGMTVSLDVRTKKLVFAFTTDIQMLTLADGNDMGDVLGIKTSDTVNSATHTAGNFPDLAGIQEIYIVSQALSDGSNLIAPNGKALPILAQIPITVDFGEIQHYSSNSPELDDVVFPSSRFGTNIRELNIQIVDRYGNLLDIGGLNLTMIVKVFHHSP